MAIIAEYNDNSDELSELRFKVTQLQSEVYDLTEKLYFAESDKQYYKLKVEQLREAFKGILS